MRDAREQLIVAMDVPTLEKVRQTVDTLGDAVSFYKVGMESFYSLGQPVLDERQEGKSWIESERNKYKTESFRRVAVLL